jgi:hypothetical protein
MHNRFMKTFAVRFLGLSILLGSAVALHAEGLQQKVEFYLDGKIGAEVVKKGSYQISYPDADQGTLEIKVGKKVVTVPFTRRAIPGEADSDKMTYRDNGDGTRAVATITPRGKKYTLVLQ